MKQVWPDTASNSCSPRVWLCSIKSLRVLADRVSIPSRSDSVKLSPKSYFHTVGAKLSGTGDLDMIANPMMHPKKWSISKWVGPVACGLSTKHSRLVPTSALLLGLCISRGRTPVSSSRAMFTSESLNGPPASIAPSPKNLTLQHRSSILFYLKFLNSFLSAMIPCMI